MQPPPRQDTYDRLAHLYDLAFAWDIAEEVDWLLARCGANVRRILEPACGSGRMFPAFQHRGVEVVGVERSPTMIDRARQRMASFGLPAPIIHQADMTRFDLHEAFDAALCPINSLNYLLGRDAVLWHLESVARHLVPDARYMVQLDLMDTSVSVDYARDDYQQWEVEYADVRLRTTWQAVSFDAGSGLQTERVRFELLGGPDAGEVYEDEHILRKWSWEEWGALIAASPFKLVAVYDGEKDRPALPLDDRVEEAHLTWHELVVS